MKTLQQEIAENKMSTDQLRKHLEKVFAAGERRVESAIKTISKESDRYLSQVELIVSKFFMDYAVNDIVDYVTARRYIDPKDVQKLKKLLSINSASDYFKSQTAKIKTATKVSRIDYIIYMILLEYEKLVNESGAAIAAALETNASAVIKASHKSLSGLEIDLTGQQISNLAKEISLAKLPQGSYKQQVESIRQTSQLQTIVPQAFARKLTQAQVTELLQNVGLKAKSRLQAVARTMNTYEFSYAVKMAMQENDIEEYEYCAVLDEKTSEICRSLNGQKFRVAQAKVGINFPPMHPNCRSFIVPDRVIQQEEELEF